MTGLIVIVLKLVFFAAIAFICLQCGHTQPRTYREDYGPPMPYNFQYNNVDEYGTQLERTETKDASGTVRGSYSYRDADGLYRIVDYIADANGFRANVRTNEPGTAKDHSGDPADTTWEIQPSPPGVIQKWAGRGYQPNPGRATGRRFAPLVRNDVGYYGDYDSNYAKYRYPRKR
ncbi:Cuticle protein 16.8-like protein [Leptotrombidium deliense]|uniref:Cuticle protein 16.8-like protein n=1 Tax=Leptotrombidium deliense TaxID=299467 RepID=A0A443SNB6_9ACAR|nr:Cuticle protein 16.8-like protein [Leptotrombidium deliense]